MLGWGQDLVEVGRRVRVRVRIKVKVKVNVRVRRGREKRPNTVVGFGLELGLERRTHVVMDL